MTSPPPHEPTDRGAASPARVVAGGLATFVATRLAATLLANLSMPAAVAQAVIAEWGASRLGVRWTEANRAAPTPPRTWREALRPAAAGLGIGLFAAAVVAGFLVATRALVVHSGTPSVAMVLISLLTAGLFAMRDELLLHGLVLRLLEPVDLPFVKVLACGLMSAAGAWGEAAGSSSIATSGLLGILFGALWIRGRGALVPWSAHAAWLFGTGAVLRGGLVDAHVAQGSWAGGDQGALAGHAAIVALLPLALAAAASVREPRSSRGGSPNPHP